MKTKKLFANLGTDGAHNGVTDLYPEHEKLLRKAFRSREDFDTGWYSVKKEIHSARIVRVGTELKIEAEAWMDDGRDLVDTLIWEVLGKNDFAGSGSEALDKLGVSEGDKLDFIEQLLITLSELDLILEENHEWAGHKVRTRSFPTLMSKLSKVVDECVQRLDNRYAAALDMVRAEIETWRKDKFLAEAAAFVHLIAGMSKDRELDLDNRITDMTNDDAVETVNGLISRARAMLNIGDRPNGDADGIPRRERESSNARLI